MAAVSRILRTLALLSITISLPGLVTFKYLTNTFYKKPSSHHSIVLLHPWEFFAVCFTFSVFTAFFIVTVDNALSTKRNVVNAANIPQRNVVIANRVRTRELLHRSMDQLREIENRMAAERRPLQGSRY